MQILSVTLRNFKTHRDRQFSFEMGTNAICGENGAGKTSILEAIAWTLFDYTPYTVDDMIREGASSAEVTVAFVSALEERTYEVRRSTATGYRLYDPQIDRRLEPEKKADVIRWLRQHLGVPAGTDLPKLFANTIGVPQGTLTADFLKPPQDRKRIFDGILKVEEYQTVYKDLLGLQKYSELQVKEGDHQLELCHVELQEWDSLQQQQQQLQMTISRDTQELDRIVTTLEQKQREITALDVVAQQLADLDRQIQQSAQAQQLKQQELERLQADVDAAQQAHELVESCREGHVAFVAAEAALKELEQQRQQRQALQEQRQQLLDAGRELDTQRLQLQQRLELLVQAEEQLTGLEPLVQQQQALEQDGRQLAVQLAQLQQLLHQQALRQAKLEAQQQQCDRTEAALQAGEGAYQQQEANREGYEQVRQAEATLLELEVQQKKRQEAMQLRADLMQQLNGLQVQEATLQEQLQRLQHLEKEIQILCNQLGQQEELEAKRSQLDTQQQQFQAVRMELQQRIKDAEDAEGKVTGLNSKIEQRKSLEPQIQRIPDIRAQLERLESQLAHLAAALLFQQELDRIYQEGVLNLSEYRQQSKQLLESLHAEAQHSPQLKSILEPISPLLHQGHSISQTLLVQIAGILEDLAQQVDGPQLKAQRQHLQGQLQEALIAQTQWGELPDLEAEHENFQQHLVKIREAIADLEWRLEAEETCLKQWDEIDRQLQELGDPRARLRIMRQEQGSYSGVQQQLQQAIASIERQQMELNQVESYLVQSAQLSDAVAQQQQLRQQNLMAYRQFLKQEELANTLPQRQQEHRDASQQLEALRTRINQFQEQLDRVIQEQGTLEEMQQTQQAIADELNSLQNPRQQVERLQKDLAQRPLLNQKLEQIESSRQDDLERLQQMQEQLAQTEEVENQFAARQQDRDRHREDFQTVVAHQGLANQLESRQKEQLQVQHQQKELELEQKKLLQRKQAAEFDPERYQQLKQTLAETETRRTQLQVQLQTAQPQLDSINQKLTQLEAVRQRVEQLKVEKKHRERVRRFIKYIRTVFRDAGPRITELYQRNVNREADRLFREILNRPAVSLQWEANYDIAVQEGGSRKRKFASLSGGEQMAAALAVRLALLRALADIDVAFFDEPTTNMDRPRRERLAEAISNIKSFKQLFVISHDDTFANITENIIRVSRE